MKTVIQITILATAFFLAGKSCGNEIERSVWGCLPDGREVEIFTLRNDSGTVVRVAEYGALLVSIDTKDKEGKIGRITLSYKSLDEALGGGVFGSVIGRFANRIDGGGFEIDGVRYDLESVNQKSGVHIHGGKTGFHRQLWFGRPQKTLDGPSVIFTLISEDGHEGYPGTVLVEASYRLEGNTLVLTYTAHTDKPTHLNLTNHVYFNLSGGGTIENHLLTLSTPQVLEIDDRNIPTGEVLSVEGTPFDFLEERRIGDSLPQLETGGLDHCFAQSGGRILPIAKLVDPESGRTLDIVTSKPGVQVFTANGFRGNPFPKWGGICFETQFFPNAPNEPTFESSLVRPGEGYRHATRFRFGVID
ncbi:MAG: aldose epimerase family protein [Verrucomicrobiota bacterium]